MLKKRTKHIPKAGKAFVGGSSTYAMRFPEDLKSSYIKLLDRQTFMTPFGESPECTFFEMNGENVISVRMHGWRAGTSRADASRQVFWIFEQAGVKTILSEGGVGAVQRDMSLRDFIIPTDYIDLSLRKDVNLSDRYLLIMRDPLCPTLSGILTKTAQTFFPQRNISHGVYAVTDGRHFESRAEVSMIELFGADVIGQSLCPEVYLAREIGACYAGIYLIVNRAEGIGPDWNHRELKEIFNQEGLNVGSVVIESLKQAGSRPKKRCQCSKLRKKTLLQ